MVCVYFVIVDGIFGVYVFFDECVVGFVYDWYVIGLFDYFNCVLGQVWVVDDFVVWLVFEQCYGQQVDQVVVFDECVGVVEEEVMVEIVVLGNVEIGVVGVYCIGCGGVVFWQQWVGDVVGECVVGFMLDVDEFEWQVWCQFVDYQIGVVVVGVDYDF